MPYYADKYLYVKNSVLEYIHSKGMYCSGKVNKGLKLNDIIKQILDEAIARAKKNFRKTVMAKDL